MTPCKLHRKDRPDLDQSVHQMFSSFLAVGLPPNVYVISETEFTEGARWIRGNVQVLSSERLFLLFPHLWEILTLFASESVQFTRDSCRAETISLMYWQKELIGQLIKRQQLPCYSFLLWGFAAFLLYVIVDWTPLSFGQNKRSEYVFIMVWWAVIFPFSDILQNNQLIS